VLFPSCAIAAKNIKKAVRNLASDGWQKMSAGRGWKRGELMKRILVIDDEVGARQLLRRVLEREGYFIVEAKDGEEGINLFRADPCDMIITDLVMPVKDGLKTILDVREFAPTVPVLAISGGGTIAKERYLAAAGFIERVETLAKPFTREELVDAVQRMLKDDFLPE
jgi:DNA-binding NtrC family response regulator